MATAKSFLDLVSPGELSRVHQAEKIDCTGCHRAGDKAAQSGLCLECHKEVGIDIRTKSGFHGKHATGAVQRCNSCHTEHKGGEADIRGLQNQTFDHALTDFPLTGAHRPLECIRCHKRDTAKRKAPSDCKSCHDSPHKDRGLERCSACHDQTLWKRVSYRHKGADFNLTGAHDKVRCVSCHGIIDFRTKANKCSDCHGLKDAHGGVFGARCDDCHVQTEWSPTAFDHKKKTDYALIGAHSKASCHACHRFDKKLPKSPDCYSCHRHNDIHTGANGKRCKECHTEQSWRIDKFDHTAVSKFALKGKHRSVACSLCHKAGISAKLETGCVSCHRTQDPHAQGLGDKCGDCHSEQGWRKLVFDHDRDTKFKLRQSHRELRCHACHTPGRSWKQPPNCVSCHKQNNVHGNNIGACENCHDESRWLETRRFHHDFTAFPLLGMHGLALCESCHRDKHYAGTERSCEGCHRKQDPHNKTYKASCETCHNPNAWSSWRFNHDGTGFRLEGPHNELACHDCHRRDRDLDGRGSTCVSCHRKDDVHEGRFGQDCSRCHNGTSFQDVDIQSLRPGVRSMGR